MDTHRTVEVRLTNTQTWESRHEDLRHGSLLLLFSRSAVSNSSVTSWTVTHQAPPSVEFSRQEYRSKLPFPLPEDLPYPGIESESSALAGGLFTAGPPRKPIEREREKEREKVQVRTKQFHVWSHGRGYCGWPESRMGSLWGADCVPCITRTKPRDGKNKALNKRSLNKG